jgi:hypothetical protein
LKKKIKITPNAIYLIGEYCFLKPEDPAINYTNTDIKLAFDMPEKGYSEKKLSIGRLGG